MLPICSTAKRIYRYPFSVMGMTLCVFLFLSGCLSNLTPSRTQPVSTILAKTENVLPREQISPTAGMILPTAPPTHQSLETLSSSTLSGNIPEDIMKEIVYFGQGNGVDSCPGSSPGNPTLEWLTSSGKYLNTGDGDFNRFELYQPITVGSCGWTNNEAVTVTHHSPDSSSITETVYADEHTYIAYKTHPSLQDLPGIYTLVLEGKSGRLEESYELVDTGSAGVSKIEDALLLYGFPPNEKVRIYAYEAGDEYASHLSFTGWQIVQVNQEGKLELGLDLALQEKRLVYLLVGETFGVLDPYGDPSCSNLPKSNLKPGEMAQTVPGTIPWLEYTPERPGIYDRRAFPEVHTVSILDGPLCMYDGIQNGIFWLVSFEDGSKNWLAEVDDQSYYYLLPEGADPGSFKTATCPNAPAQRVNLWDSIYVCTERDDVIVREAPQRSAGEVARLAPGTEAYITDGPECADGWSWWMIQSGDDIAGWVSEGGDQVDPYFICPVE